MTLKNKDFIKLFQRLDRYFKMDESIFIEGLKLSQKKPTCAKHIYIYNEVEDFNDYDFCMTNREGKKPRYMLFYTNENKNLDCYYFDNLEEEITNFHVLKAFNILSNLKILKLVDF